MNSIHNTLSLQVSAQPQLQPLALIAAAGTGGHIIPGLAIAAQLQARGWQVQWIGTQHGMENTLVPPTHIFLHRLRFAGLRGKGPLGMLKGVWNLGAALLSCVRFIRDLKSTHSAVPIVLVGMGGYVCVPAAWAARLFKIPLVLVNADAELLLSNKSLAGFAQSVCCGFEGAAAQLNNAIVTGNPIRAAVANMATVATRYAARSGGLNVLIVGGSLGAQVLNDIVPQALSAWQLANRGLANVWHQTGAKQLTRTQDSYRSCGVAANVVSFIDDMASAYAWADVVICRAGAITVSELCAAGVPAVLVPLLASTTRHQEGNAQYLALQGAGIHLPQALLTAQSLSTILQGLTRDNLQVMAKAALALGKPNATQAVVSVIEQAIT
jgi:UDP-N-acetylglucosamine--N-acetylmuramyl-(pentapeptide) pyrophosphoryl-undecaprenol N-acetylglucosamine transferase